MWSYLTLSSDKILIGEHKTTSGHGEKMIRFQCHCCSEAYEVQGRHAGKAATCAKCKALIDVPQLPLSMMDATVYGSQPPAQQVHPNLRVTLDQPQKTATGGFFRAFGITSGFMAAIAIVAVSVPILACGGCLGMALLFAPSEEQLERMRAASEARAAERAKVMEQEFMQPEL
jgi:hypothetical protein